MLLFIDNYDSFTYNIVQYLAQLGQDVAVRCNDEITLDEIAAIEAAIAGGGKHLPEFTVRVYDDHGDTVALVRRVVYVRLKKELRPQAGD